jgi:hypothetical protein
LGRQEISKRTQASVVLVELDRTNPNQERSPHLLIIHQVLHTRLFPAAQPLVVPAFPFAHGSSVGIVMERPWLRLADGIAQRRSRGFA